MADTFEITTLGEMMLRLSVPVGKRLETATQYDVNPAGAESNVVGALARLGRRCAWIGGLPLTALGRFAANHLRQCGVSQDGVIWCDRGRMGTYFVEFAVPPRPIEVIYDRAESCAALLKPDQVNWNVVLNTRLLHLTGITPALSPGCRALTHEALSRAKAKGVPISFDINYRQKLWSPTEASHELRELIQAVEILFCSRADAERVFGFEGSPEQVIQQLADLSRAKNVVLTLGDGGLIALDDATLRREAILPTQIIDRLGAGDALAAGVIHGWLDNDWALGLKRGAALAALALSQHGDMLVTTPQELTKLLESGNTTVSR